MATLRIAQTNTERAPLGSFPPLRTATGEAIRDGKHAVRYLMDDNHTMTVSFLDVDVSVAAPSVSGLHGLGYAAGLDQSTSFERTPDTRQCGCS